MSRTSAIRDAWRPQTRQDRDAILLELHEVLSSPHFCNSKRYPALLKYTVEKTLAGESDQLKERTLGVEVFDRPASYDTNADTVVRYTAGEVRKRLSLYYSDLGRKPAIRISLPAGSYVPEFFREHDEIDGPAEAAGLLTPHAPMPSLFAYHSSESHDHGEPLRSTLALRKPLISTADHYADTPRVPARSNSRRAAIWVLAAVAFVIGALAGVTWKDRTVLPKTAADNFWAPVLHDQSALMVCIGGSVFSQSHLSGVATATKDVDYPFISIQSAAGAAQLSALLERNGGVTTQLRSAATTPLTELREHPVILLGGYNNQWSLRLLQPLRFHFAPVENGEWIVDAEHPEKHWERDANLPYSSAEDYALVARFHDATTDNWVVVLAGVGRNGTEAAAQFATSPHYMQLFRDQVGSDFANKNVEAVLKVSVIDGKTGAPAILATHAW